MRNVIILMVAWLGMLTMSLFQSCSIIKKQKNRLKERVETHVVVKSDSSGVKTTDSMGDVKTTDTHHSRETNLLDTNILVDGTTQRIKTEVPDTGETHVFETDAGSIEVGLDGDGNLEVVSKTKPKHIGVKIASTREVYDTHGSEVKTNVARMEAARVTSSLQVDSGRHTNSVVLNKSVNRVGAWWWWLILVVVLCYVGFKVYTKGINPILWFK